MALSADDKKRLVELANRAKPPPATEEAGRMRLAGSAAAPVPLNVLRLGRGGLLAQLRAYAGPLLLLGVLPLLGLAAGTWYAYRYDLHLMDFGAVFDSSAGLTMRHRFMDQVHRQQQKRRLLDAGHAFGFASEHMAATHNANQVLALDPDNVEARALRSAALSRQVVFASGALQAGSVEEAIARVQLVLAEEPGHAAASALLGACVDELVRRARVAYEARNYEEAGALVHQAETIRPGHAGARELHLSLVQHHVRRADNQFLHQKYLAALEEIVRVRRLDGFNPRAEALFDKIDEKIGFPQVAVNSIMEVRGRPRVMATIEGTAVQLEVDDEHGNIRIASIDPRNGLVVVEQIYTREQQRLTKVPGSRGEWITAAQ